jgi:hypothetical protein
VNFIGDIKPESVPELALKGLEIGVDISCALAELAYLFAKVTGRRSIKNKLYYHLDVDLPAGHRAITQ